MVLHYTSDLPAGIGAPEAGENGLGAIGTAQGPPRMDSMKSVWSPFNPSNTQMGVCPALLPMLHPHGGPVRTWGPDFRLKRSNVMSDFQS